jgi:hypothetical protein
MSFPLHLLGIKGSDILLAHPVGFLRLAIALHPLLLVQESLRPVVVILRKLKVLKRRLTGAVFGLL